MGISRRTTVAAFVTLSLLAHACGGGSASVDAYRGGPERTGTYAESGPRELGQLLWTASGASRDLALASPTVSDGVLFIADDRSGLSAFDVEDGALLWRVETDDDVWSTPAVFDGVVYFGSDDARLYAVDSGTGQVRWRFRADAAVRGSPIVEHGTVYAATLDVSGAGGGGSLYAIDIATGQESWRFLSDAGGFSASPAVVDGTVFALDDYGMVFALDATDGDLLWRYNTLDKAYYTELIAQNTPAVSGGVVYVVLRSSIRALDARDGEVLWQREFDGGLFSSPAVDADRVLVAPDRDALYALDARTGEQQWRFSRDDSFSTPSIAGDVVYIGVDGELVALDVASGELLWGFRTEAEVYSAPVVWGGAVFFSDADGFIYAVR